MPDATTAITTTGGAAAPEFPSQARVVVRGDGHFLGQPSTLARMRSDFVYPEVGDRRAPSAWEEDGGHDVRHRARERVRDILSSHYPDHLDPERDRRIRDAFDIRISREDMRPGSGRW